MFSVSLFFSTVVAETSYFLALVSLCRSGVLERGNSHVVEQVPKFYYLFTCGSMKWDGKVPQRAAWMVGKMFKSRDLLKNAVTAEGEILLGTL